MDYFGVIFAKDRVGNNAAIQKFMQTKVKSDSS